MNRLLLSIIVLLIMGLAGVAQSATSHVSAVPDRVIRHHLEVTIDPARHFLHATDDMFLPIVEAGMTRLTFTLHTGLQVQSVERIVTGQRMPVTVDRRQGIHEGMPVQMIDVSGIPSPAVGDVVHLRWMYEGVVHEPPREPTHLRFVTPSETAGHIGDEGVYLSGETHWYPDMDGALSRFDVEVSVPWGWRVVTHGRLIREFTAGGKAVEQWGVETKTEALTLVANRFVRASRTWNNVEVQTYLFQEDAALAEEYLSAAITYLETYSHLLGPYPYPKFAVVENFFASGLGMPSFTLLGSEVIKRHYVQPYALGHEIVHSWIGNWVFNKPGTGNWVEGLTTYLANYYYEELTGTSEQARDQRRLLVYGYSLYVGGEGQDYPVRQFTRKVDQRDNAIGYQKAAMVFHMLRREVGDAAFWRALRALIAGHGQQFADWADVEAAFSSAGGTDLRWFFAQWINRAGAPRLERFEAEWRQDTQTLAVRVRQAAPPYRVRLPIVIDEPDGTSQVLWADLAQEDHIVTLALPGPPERLYVDPAFEVFRRIERSSLPPMLNLFLTAPRRVVHVPTDSATGGPYQAISSRLANQPGASITEIRAEDGELPKDASSLFLGEASRTVVADRALRGCGGAVRLDADGITIEQTRYATDRFTVLISCRHPDNPEHVVSFFVGGELPAVTKIARLLFFYGWSSYVVFEGGAVIRRGDVAGAHPVKVTRR